MAYQFKIKLRGVSKPPVWRRVIVNQDITFYQFHLVIMGAFGWMNRHLFTFCDKGWGSDWYVELPQEELFPSFVDKVDARKAKLCDYFEEGYTKLIYIYDLGDDWIHEIVLEERVNLLGKEAICVEGKGQCPLEDCGGPQGYERMKNIIANHPNSKNAKELKDRMIIMMAEDFDPTHFNLEESNRSIEYYLSDEFKDAYLEEASLVDEDEDFVVDLYDDDDYDDDDYDDYPDFDDYEEEEEEEEKEDDDVNELSLFDDKDFEDDNDDKK